MKHPEESVFEEHIGLRVKADNLVDKLNGKVILLIAQNFGEKIADVGVDKAYANAVHTFLIQVVQHFTNLHYRCVSKKNEIEEFCRENRFEKSSFSLSFPII